MLTLINYILFNVGNTKEIFLKLQGKGREMKDILRLHEPIQSQLRFTIYGNFHFIWIRLSCNTVSDDLDEA